MANNHDYPKPEPVHLDAVSEQQALAAAAHLAAAQLYRTRAQLARVDAVATEAARVARAPALQSPELSPLPPRLSVSVLTTVNNTRQLYQPP